MNVVRLVRFSALFLLLSLFQFTIVPPGAMAEARWESDKELFEKADAIAAVTISSVTEISLPRQGGGKYTKKAQAILIKRYKGTVPKSFEIVGGEDVFEPGAWFSKGDSLVFLQRIPSGFCCYEGGSGIWKMEHGKVRRTYVGGKWIWTPVEDSIRPYLPLNSSP